MMPTRPLPSRKAISFSPSSISRTGGPSALSSEESTAGTQYSRMKLPISVPGPTRVRSSLSLISAMTALPTMRNQFRKASACRGELEIGRLHRPRAPLVGAGIGRPVGGDAAVLVLVIGEAVRARLHGRRQHRLLLDIERLLHVGPHIHEAGAL